MGTVDAVFIAAAAGVPMQAVPAIMAEPGSGLRGDRYATRRGEWSRHGACEVTLIAGEVLDDVAATGGPDLSAGAHRRNVVTRGVRLEELDGRRFRVGAAVLRGTGPRPPCRYLERLLRRQDVRRALAGARGGICAAVVLAGEIRPGDPVTLLDE